MYSLACLIEGYCIMFVCWPRLFGLGTLIIKVLLLVIMWSTEEYTYVSCTENSYENPSGKHKDT